MKKVSNNQNIEKNTKNIDENTKNVSEGIPRANSDVVEIAKLSSRVANLSSQNADLINDLQRTRADFENFRRQTELQKTKFGENIKMATVEKLLPLLDDIERAIAAQPEVLAPLSKNFNKTLKELKLQKIDTTPGSIFNPNLHDAISVTGSGEKEQIRETLRSGYYYEGAILRPALVQVEKK